MSELFETMVLQAKLQVKSEKLVTSSSKAPLHHHEADVGVRNQGSLEAVALPCLQAPGKLSQFRARAARAEGRRIQKSVRDLGA